MKYIPYTKGFTIIETLVAVTIFSVSIAAMIALTSRGIQDMNLVKNKYTATYLAQEGIELVRYIRDDQYVATGNSANTGWTNFNTALVQCVGTGCNIDSIAKTVTSCSLPANCIMHINNTTGYYYGNGDGVYSTYPTTPFTRVITLDTSSTGSGSGIGAGVDEFKVTSTVTWQQGLLSQRVSTSENIFNWFKQP